MTLAEYLDATAETQAAFAARVGTSQAWISTLASGEGQPSVDLIARIAEATGGLVPVTAWFPVTAQRPAARSIPGEATK